MQRGHHRFTTITHQEAGIRANERMSQHPLNANEIDHSGHYMLCLMEDEIAGYQKKIEELKKEIDLYRNSISNTIVSLSSFLNSNETQPKTTDRMLDEIFSLSAYITFNTDGSVWWFGGLEYITEYGKISSSFEKDRDVAITKLYHQLFKEKINNENGCDLQ